jgi:autotransporter-associated beta strand protein
MKKLCVFLSVVVILSAGLQPAYAVTKTWNGGSSTDWNTAANWSPNGVPASGDDVVMGNFVPGNQSTLSGSTTILSLTIKGRSATAGTRGAMLTIANGVTLTITNGLTINGSTGGTPGVALGITAVGTASVSVGGAVLTVNATGGPPEEPSITFGSGTLTVTGNFTLGTTTTFTAGTGIVNFNLASGTQTVNNGSGENFHNITHSGAGTIQALTNAVTATNSFNNSGGGTVDLHALALTVGDLQGNGTITNGIAGTPLLTIGSDNGNTTFSGIIQNPSGTIALTKIGTGILTLSGLNTYTGATTINAGTISINTLQSVNGGASSLGAPTTIANGTIAIGATGVLQYTGTGHGSDRVIDLEASGGTLDASGSGTLTLAGNVTGSGFNLVLTGTGWGYLSGIIATGSGTVTKNGTNTWTLAGQNTYTGITYINVGIIKFGAHGNTTTSGPLGTTAGGTIIASGGALDLAGYSENSNETLSLNGSGTDTWGVLRNSGAADTYAGLITLTGPSYIDAYNGTIAISNTGTITGAGFGLTLGGTQGGTLSSILGTGTGTLSKIEAGTWTLSGANTFTGLTTVSAGILMYGANNALSSTNVTVSAGTLDLSTYTQSARTGTLTVSNGAMYRIAGPNTLPTYSASYSFGTSSTVEYYGTSQTIANQPYGNLTLSGSGTKTAAGSFTVNGILNLSILNPSATVGLLVMGANTLTMGASATTIGPGDVTGIVTRTTLVAATSYTFGNQYTTINFQNIGTLPTAVSMNITIGTAPSWKTDAIKRYYDIIRTGGSGSFATLNLHYLDTELNSNSEDKLVNWACESPFTPGTGIEYGRSNYDLTNNWVGTADVDISLWHTTFGLRNQTLAVTAILSSTWNGSSNTVWVKPTNWTPTGVPSDLADVTIPDASTTPNDPKLGTTLLIGRLTLNSGAILNAAAGSTATISGGSGAWSNNGGTFNPNTSTVIFTSPGATISGITNFNNVTINSGALLTMASNGTMRIGGTMTNNGTWQAGQLTNNTVEYNGSGSQTVLEPNGTSPGYDNLILSGSGTKTMPGTAMSISGNFSMAGTPSATAGSGLTIGGNVTLGSGTTFNASAFTHNLAGNWTNSGGTITAGSSTINFNGTSPQTLTGPQHSTTSLQAGPQA